MKEKKTFKGCIRIQKEKTMDSISTSIIYIFNEGNDWPKGRRKVVHCMYNTIPSI